MRDSLPLTAELKDGAVQIEIGQHTLSFAAEHHPGFYTDEDPEENPLFRVIDSEAFSKDVLNELNRENEVGDSLLTEMLDKAIERAIENGSEGVLFLSEERT